MSNNNVQTTYLLNPVVAPIEGTQANTMLEGVTPFAAESIIPYGRVVVRGTADRGCLLISGSGQLFLGVSLANFAAVNPYNPPNAQEATQYNITDIATIMQNGTVWVWNETAVTPGQPVYYRYSANGPNTVLGRFSNVTDAGHNTLLPGAQWITTQATIGGLAQMQFSIQ